nr:PAS domain S-box protein [Pyrinomonadaceae bacterium]
MDQGAAKIGVGLRGQGLLDKLPSLVWTQSPEGTIDVVNRTWREYTGLDIEESGGFDWSSIVHPEDTPTLREKLNSDRASELVNAQVRLRRADGEFKWFQLQANAVPNPKKAYQNWAIVAIDIHDQKIREDAIRSAENNFRLIVESIPIPVAVTTPTGEVEALNKLTLDYFGRTFEELKAWKASDVVHPDDLEATIRSQIESHESGNAYNVQSRHLRHDGVYRWFNVIGLPLKDEEDRILRWFHLQVDIEDQKRAEYALRTHEHNLKLIIDTTPALAWSAGSNGRLDYFNKHSLDYLGMSEEEAIAGAWTDAVHPDDEHNLASTWKRILTSERPGEAEFRLRRHDGEYRWFLLRANPLFDGTGTVLRWYGVNTDIQDRKESEARLQESEQRFRTLFEEAGAGITLLELDPVSPIRTNRAMQSMLGCAGEELSTVEMFTAMTAEENREQDLDLFVELRQGKRDTLRQEKHFILKDGSSVWANGIFTLLRDPNGNPKSVISIHEDVTERKLALEKLQAYQDLLELAQKSAGAMAFDWYVKKEINYWSPEQEALFGLKPGTFDGTFKSWKKMMYQPDWPVVVEAIKRAEKTGEVEAEYRVIWPDGSLHWLATNGRMFFDDSGEPLRMVGFTSDVTRRKLAEEELRRSEAFLAEGQYLARLGNFSWNVETEEILWSEQLYRTFAFDLEEPVTLDLIATRVHPDDMGLLYDMVDRARRGASDFEYEHRLLLPDNSVKYVHLIAHRTPDDAKLEYIGAVQDVTQRRLSEEALSEARSELARVARAMSLGVLTASIAHEVNQPLS